MVLEDGFQQLVVLCCLDNKNSGEGVIESTARPLVVFILTGFELV